MSDDVKPYEIASAGELRRRLLEGMPADTQIRRETVTTLPADLAGWIAVDPMYFRPGQSTDRIGVAYPVEGALEVRADLLQAPGGMPRVAAVEVVSDTATPDGVRELESDSVAVDSGRILIARANALQSAYRVGGPHATANLRHATDFFAKHEETKAAYYQAFGALSAHGIQLAQVNDVWRVQGDVTDELIERGSAVLEQTGLPITLAISETSTGAQLERLITPTTAIAALVIEGETIGVITTTGFGDGQYWVDELLSGDRVVGHRIDFLRDA